MQEGWGGREDPLRQRDPSAILQHGGQTGFPLPLTVGSSAEAGPWEVKPDFTCAHGSPTVSRQLSGALGMLCQGLFTYLGKRGTH